MPSLIDGVAVAGVAVLVGLSSFVWSTLGLVTLLLATWLIAAIVGILNLVSAYIHTDDR